MAEQFKVGDRVGWNSEAGHVSGSIIKIHTRDFNYKGHTHRASPDSPQYEIQSGKTDHIAAHKGSALSKLSDDRPESRCNLIFGNACPNCQCLLF